MASSPLDERSAPGGTIDHVRRLFSLGRSSGMGFVDAVATGMRALLVEDELLVREVAAEDLAECGFDVSSASDGDEALAILRESADFDLLFTDIRMPGATDGWELARVAKQLIPGLRIIFATGLGEADDGLDERECVVRKPYNLRDLRHALGALGFASDT